MRIALIGARAGSKRLSLKSFRDLGGKPLYRWTLDAALDSKVFDEVWFCTDHRPIPEDLPEDVEWFPRSLSSDDERDFDWIREWLLHAGLWEPISDSKFEPVELCLLRPTSPFRGPETIRRAFDQWEASQPLDSLRAVRRSREHPAKQWIVEDSQLYKIRPDKVMSYSGIIGSDKPAVHRVQRRFATMRPWSDVSGKKKLYEMPTQSLVDTYIQTGGLEIFRASNLSSGSLSGDRVGMFLCEGLEGLDINDRDDWAAAERIVAGRGFAQSYWAKHWRQTLAIEDR